MPVIQLPLISYEELVSEPLKKQLAEMVGGDIHYINSTGNKRTISEGIDLANADEAKVVVNEDDYHDSSLSNNVTAENIRYSLIEDKSIGLRISLGDVEKDFTINVSKRFTTRGEAIWWRNSIIGNLRDSTSNQTFDIHISPCIPANLLNLVEECRLRKVQRQCEEREFMSYLIDISAPSLDMDTNSTGTSAAVTFPETLKDCVVSLPTELPNPTLEDGKYLLEFTFRTTIKIPSTVIVRYPYFIGDKMMPKEMIDFEINANTDERLKAAGNPLDNLLSFEGYVKADYREYCYQVPSFESYIFPMANWNLSPIFQIRVSGELSDPHLVCNLNALFRGPIDGYKLSHSILEYIVDNKTGCLNPNDSAISVILMKGYDMVTPGQLYIDDHLCLRTQHKMDMLGDYHLVIATPLQTASIPTNIMATVEEKPKLLNDLIKHTNPEINPEVLPETPVATPEIYRELFDAIIEVKNNIGPITANVLVVNTN